MLMGIEQRSGAKGRTIPLRTSKLLVDQNQAPEHEHNISVISIQHFALNLKMFGFCSPRSARGPENGPPCCGSHSYTGSYSWDFQNNRLSSVRAYPNREAFHCERTAAHRG